MYIVFATFVVFTSAYRKAECSYLRFLCPSRAIAVLCYARWTILNVLKNELFSKVKVIFFLSFRQHNIHVRPVSYVAFNSDEFNS